MSLAGVLGLPGAHRGPDLQAGTLADRPEPPLQARGGDDERRRLRHRLVWRRGDTGCLPQRRAGLERLEPSRAGGAPRVTGRVRAHTRLVRNAGAADELPSVPPRAVALDAQRAHRRLPPREAGSRAPRRSGALSRDSGLERLGAFLLPGPDIWARGRPAARRRAGGRAHRGDWSRARGRAPDSDDCRDHRWPARLGVPVLERGEVAIALLLHGREHASPHPPGAPCAGRALGRVTADRLGAAPRPRGGVERGSRVELRRHPGRTGRDATVRPPASRRRRRLLESTRRERRWRRRPISPRRSGRRCRRA